MDLLFRILMMWRLNCEQREAIRLLTSNELGLYR